MEEIIRKWLTYVPDDALLDLPRGVVISFVRRNSDLLENFPTQRRNHQGKITQPPDHHSDLVPGFLHHLPGHASV